MTRTLTRDLRLLAAVDLAEARRRRSRLLAERGGASAGLLADVLSAAIELGAAEGRLAESGQACDPACHEVRARLREAVLALSDAAGAVDGEVPATAVAEARTRITRVAAEVGRLPAPLPRQEYV
ncbi:hypothetical protein [Herbidospora mongoliensis]|uniref:hypothetical protein n=1 Tax=Herbidospora mongoliensis TaxID=688067 RepID=UPI000831AFE8|nr:hypothetical protein [Herbidospora mongoliensis]